MSKSEGGWRVCAFSFSVGLGAVVAPCHYLLTPDWAAREVAVVGLAGLLFGAILLGQQRIRSTAARNAKSDERERGKPRENRASDAQLDSLSAQRQRDLHAIQAVIVGLPTATFFCLLMTPHHFGVAPTVAHAYAESTWIVCATATLMTVAALLPRVDNLRLAGRHKRFFTNILVLLTLTTVGLSAARPHRIPIDPPDLLCIAVLFNGATLVTAFIGMAVFVLIAIACEGLGEQPPEGLHGNKELVTSERLGCTKEPFGLALSGGGVRAGTVALGALRQLSSAGALEKFAWLSSVSGGGWAVGAVLSRLVQRTEALGPRRQSDAEGETPRPSSALAPIEAAIVRFREARDYLGLAEGAKALVAPILYTVIATATSLLAIALALVSMLSLLLYVDQTRLEVTPGLPTPYTAKVSELLSWLALRMDPALAWMGVTPMTATGDKLASARGALATLMLFGWVALAVSGLLILASQTRTVGRLRAFRGLPRTIRTLGSVGVVLSLTAAMLIGLLFSLKLAIGVLVLLVLLSTAVRTLDWPAARTAAMGGVVLSAIGWALESFVTIRTAVGAMQDWWAGKVSWAVSGLLDSAALFGKEWIYPTQTGLLAFACSFATAFYLLGILIALEQLGLGTFWRDRLDGAFWRAARGELALTWDAVRQHTGSGHAFPIPIINATLNSPTSEDGGAHFEFTPTHTGGQLTQWRVELDEHNRICSLVDALAISSAALNSQGGSSVPKPLRGLLSLVPLKMGRWLRAPGTSPETFQPLALEYLGLEAFGFNSPDDPFVLISDGGHLENLGLLALLRRGAEIMLCIDSAADPAYTFDDLTRFLGLARRDGWDIDLNLSALCPAAVPDASGLRSAAEQVTIGTLTRGHEKRWLVYAKSNPNPRLNAAAWAYARREPDFPQQATTDQLFDDEQFEAYLDLGRTLGDALLKGLQQARALRADEKVRKRMATLRN